MLSLHGEIRKAAASQAMISPTSATKSAAPRASTWMLWLLVSQIALTKDRSGSDSGYWDGCVSCALEMRDDDFCLLG